MSGPISVPQIHEEPVASVLRILQLRQVGDSGDAFEGDSLPQIRRVYGGQVVAQALLASASTVTDPQRLPHSLHAYFLRGGNPDRPMSFDVTRLRDGRSFSARAATAWQEGREILTMTSSFHANEGGADAHVGHPDVPEPEDVPSALELFRTLDHPVAKFLGKTAAFDVRHVQKSLYVGPAPESSPVQQLWMRPRAELPTGTPQVVQRALLAYVVDQVMLEPSLRSVGLHWSAPGLSLASLDHAMWFHRDVDINDWLLFEGISSSVGSSRAKADVRVFSRGGTLVATAAQEGMVRVPGPNAESSGHWTFTE